MLQMCWLSLSSCEPFVEFGLKNDISGSKKSSAFILQHVHLLFLCTAFGELSHCNAHKKYTPSASQAGYVLDSYFLLPVCILGRSW